jgi:serine/threonine protein kinase
MAPELFDGGAASVQSDIYSLGALLFFLATGEFPTTGRTYDEIAQQHRDRDCRWLRALRPDFPATFVEAIDRVLHVDPQHRFASADEFGASILLEVA